MLQFNDIIREEADRHGVLVMDFQHYPIAQDQRLFSERPVARQPTRSRAGGGRVGLVDWASMASTQSWAAPFPDPPPRPRTSAQLAEDVHWARRYFAPWLGKGILRIPTSGVTAKRPVLTRVPSQRS